MRAERRWTRRTGERGASLVEGAFAAPVFFLLVFAVFEFGLVFRQYLTVSSAGRSAARAASAAGNSGRADYLILKEIQRATTAIDNGGLQLIIVFKASASSTSLEDDPILRPCLLASQPGLCNRYVASDLDRPARDFADCTAGSSSPDRFWCPTTRRVSASGPPDLIGVYLGSQYSSVSSIFGRTYDFSEQTVFRLEPQTR